MLSFFKRKNTQRHMEPMILKGIFEQSELDVIIKTIDSFSDWSEGNLYLPYKYNEVNIDNESALRAKKDAVLNKLQNNLFEPFVTRLNERQGVFEVQTINDIGNSLLNDITIRLLKPQKVDIHLHCDNEFPLRLNTINDILSKYMIPQDFISVVLMIQKPEKGGEFIIYDEYWTGLENVDQQRSLLSDSKISTQKTKHIISLDAGDMLIFEAGRTWHRVNEVGGERARITAGGFMGKSLNANGSWVLWS